MKKPLYLAIKKSVSGRLLTYIFQFASLAIYARLFTPEEFGVIASIQVFVIFFQVLADVGIGPAIINEDEFGANKRDGVFTVTALLGVLLSFIFFFFSYLLNSFYNEYQYQDIAVFVCVALFFYSLNIVPMTAMNKDAKFLHLAFSDIFVEFISLSLVYLLYLQNFGLLALACRPAIQASTKFIIIWYLSKRTELGRPFFGSEVYHIKKILGFSLYQFGFNFINYFSRNLDNILIAKYFGMSSVGIYEKSYQLMRYPLMVTTFAMTPAIQPILTKFRDDKLKIIEEHNRLTSRLLVISLPVSVFIYLNSTNIILFLFGEQWLAVEPLIKVFTFMIPIQAVASTAGSFFQVMNKPKLLFISGVISAIVNVTAIVVGIILGRIEYVAILLVIGFSINFFQAYFILFKYCFQHSSKSFYFLLLKSLLIILLPCILYYLINDNLLEMYKHGAVLDFILNIFVGLTSITLFLQPIRKLLSA